MTSRHGLLVVLLAGWLVVGRAQELGHPRPATTQAEFFTTTAVHEAHLTLRPDQWAALQPRQTAAATSGFGFGGFGGGLQGPEGARNGVAARAGISFEYVHADLEIDGQRFTDVAVRYKGNGSFLRARGTNKISLKVDLNKHVKGQKLAGLSTINFQNNITDIGWMNEVVSYRLYRDAGVPAPRTAYARVYMTVAGQFDRRYLGLYSISENVDTNFIEDRFGTKRGAILKPSTRSPFTHLGDDWRLYNQIYDPKTDLTEDEKRRIIEFCRLVSSASAEEFNARIADYVDLDAFARYFAVLVWIGNSDSLLQIGQNYYVYMHGKTGRLHFIPWDQDFSFGNFRNDAGGWTIHYPWSGQNLLLSRIYDVESFRTKYLDYMRTFSRTIFLRERFADQMKEIVPAIRPSIAAEGTEWLPGFDQVASGQAGILPFVTRRAAFVAGELSDGRK